MASGIMGMLRGGRGDSGGVVQHTVGNALVLHAEDEISAEAQSLALSMVEDAMNDVVVLDLGPGLPISSWESMATVLPRRRRGIRLVACGQYRNGAAMAGQWLSERLKRTVIAPDGDLVRGSAGTLFVHSTPGSGWVRFRAGKAPTWDSKRYPAPLWDQAATEQRASSSTGEIEPLPGGVWIHDVRDPETIGAHRARLVADVPCQPETMTVLLGCPGTAPLSLDDVVRFWRDLDPDSRARTRFVQYGDVRMPEGEAFGQALADLLGTPIVCYPGVPVGGPQKYEIRTVRPDGVLGWAPFALELGYVPRVTPNTKAPRPAVLRHRAPLTWTEEIAPRVYWYAPDAVVEVVQAGLWVRSPEEPVNAERVRAAALDPEGNTLVFDDTVDTRADRMRELARDLNARLHQLAGAGGALFPASVFVPGTARPGPAQAWADIEPAAAAPEQRNAPANQPPVPPLAESMVVNAITAVEQVGRSAARASREATRAGQQARPGGVVPGVDRAQGRARVSPSMPVVASPAVTEPVAAPEAVRAPEALPAASAVVEVPTSGPPVPPAPKVPPAPTLPAASQPPPPPWVPPAPPVPPVPPLPVPPAPPVPAALAAQVEVPPVREIPPPPVVPAPPVASGPPLVSGPPVASAPPVVPAPPVASGPPVVSGPPATPVSAPPASEPAVVAAPSVPAPPVPAQVQVEIPEPVGMPPGGAPAVVPPPAVVRPPAADDVAEAVRIQPVPSSGASALLPKRALDEERGWLRRTLSREFDAMASSVSRIMSEHPGMQGGGLAAEDVLADSVAVRLYLSHRGEGVDAGLRSGRNGPHVPLARCVVSGLSRLPSFRGSTIYRMSPGEQDWELYTDRRLATDWSFVNALSGPCSGQEGDTDVLIWSMTARRTGLLEPESEEKIIDRVVFLPGTSFKILETRRPSGAERGAVLLREIGANEIDDSGRVDSNRVSLDELAVTSLRRSVERWAGAEGRRRIGPASGRRFAVLPGLERKG